MADIEYSIKSTLPIEVHVGASEASATICWLGVVKDNTNCLKCDEEKIYCENVYIGANGCVEGESSERRIEGTLTWNNISIPYVIIQDPTICSTCGEESCDVELLNHWVSPYIITPTTTSTTLYWEYWFTDEFENDDCDIIREKVLSSTTITDLDDKDCDDPVRTVPIKITVPTTCEDKKFDINAEYFVQKPDVCCKLSGDCYEINEIVYSPTSVPSSGGMVDFSFDYKRIEIDENCEVKETYGTYFGKWNVPECKGDECCFTKAVESSFTWNDICGRGDVSGCSIVADKYDDGDLVYISSSGDDITFSSVALNDKNTIYLSILREKSFSADCEIHCDFDTVYCVDKSTVYTEYYDYDSGQWSGITSGITEDNEPISIINNYAYPYYGGRLRVSWKYYIITIYEDCSVGISKDNKYTDLLTIAENDNCKDHEDYCNTTLSMKQTSGKNGVVCADSGDTLTISVIGEIDAKCNLEIQGSNCVSYSGGDIIMKGTPSSGSKSTRSSSRGNTDNTSDNNNDSKECKKIVASPNCVGYDGGEIVIGPASTFKIPYIFKKGLCELPSNQLSAVISNLPEGILPDNICPSEDEEDKPKCNEFDVTFYQFEKDCNPDCVPCFYRYMIDDVASGGSAVTLVTRSDCELGIFAYGDGEKNSDGKFKNDCEDWVDAAINAGSVTFNISANTTSDGKTGPYRRGKVIFVHDNGCKEEIIINQDGTTSNEDYIPDPGYNCDMHLEFANGDSGCIGYGGGTITIEVVGGGDVQKYCIDYGGGTITISPPSCASVDTDKCVDYGGGTITIDPPPCATSTTVITFGVEDNVRIEGCDKKYKIGTYSYTGSKPNINSFYYHIDQGSWIDNFTFGEPNESTKTGDIYVKTKEPNPSTTASRTSTDCKVNYRNEETYKQFTVTQSPNPGNCNNDFQQLLDGFNDIIEEQRNSGHPTYRTVEEGTDLYDYLYEAYYDAVAEYESNNSSYFSQSTYEEVFKDGSNSQWGTNNQYETDGTAKKAMTSWLMAMQLSEIYPDYTNGTTNTQTKFFKAAYDLFEESGHGRTIPLYGKFTLKGDVNIARLAASAIYARHRRLKTFALMNAMRRSVGSSPITTDSFDLGQTTPLICDSHDANYNYDVNGIQLGYGINLFNILPASPGPFATNHAYCTDYSPIRHRHRPQEQREDLFNASTENYKFDEQVDNFVTTNYNLSNSTYFSRFVQAYADSSDEVYSMLGNKTYYEYRPNEINPRNHQPADFWPTRSTDKYFQGVFNSGVTKVDMSYSVTYPSSTLSTPQYTEIGAFFISVIRMAADGRSPILIPSWGRLRPGQGKEDALFDNQFDWNTWQFIPNTVYPWGTARYECGTDTRSRVLTNINNCHNCNYSTDSGYNLNTHENSTLDKMVGAGTRTNNAGITYCDVIGCGEFKNGDPYVGDQNWLGVGDKHYCCTHHASTYPSGHSSESWVFAILLMLMLPKDRIYDIYKAAYSFTVSRTIMRAHWNSDIIYGRLIATMIAPIVNSFGDTLIDTVDGKSYNVMYEEARELIRNLPQVN